MPATYVPMVIDQGEDFTCEIIWTDDQDEPQNVIAPCQLDIKTSAGVEVISLETPVAIETSSSMGLIQLHITEEQSIDLDPGVYEYDLFVTVHDNALNEDQVVRLLYGTAEVRKRITELEN